MIKENIKLSGIYYFIQDGKIIRTVKNQLIKDQIHHMKNLLLGYVPPDISIRYCAVGTGTTAADEEDSTLETEGDRIYRTNLYGQGNLMISEFTFGQTDAIGTWSEVGIFCGYGVATDVADTGYLLSRAIINPTVTKTSGKELTIRHVLTWNY